MFIPTIACYGCSLSPLPWKLQFVNPDHVYLAWAIVLFAVFLIFLPFLKGYRLGGHVPYSLIRHIILTLVLMLFPIGFTILSPHPLSFGSSLLDLFYLPFYTLIGILSSALSFELPKILGLLAGFLVYLLYCMVVARIMLKVDRWLYKKQSTVDPGI